MKGNNGKGVKDLAVIRPALDSQPLEKNRPVKTFAVGRAKARIWANAAGPARCEYRVDFLYEENGWSRRSFGKEDIPNMISAAKKARRWMAGRPTRSLSIRFFRF